MTEKLNFTVGPVMQEQYILDAGYRQIPYFRTDDFSRLMFENERMLCSLVSAPENSRCVFFTGSGTASMEAAVMNLLAKEDTVAVVNGGSFGERFAELCAVHELDFTEIKVKAGEALTDEQLSGFSSANCSAFLTQHCETSTGVLYDIPLISDFCRRTGALFILDCISTFLAEPVNMMDSGIDAVIIGSQKALALPPGISAVILSPRAIERALNATPKSLYLNMKLYLKNGERGQTPFTPAAGILIQMHERLKRIVAAGGAETEIARVRRVAEYFRERIHGLPLSIFPQTLCNSVTALKVGEGQDAVRIFNVLKDRYDIFICPNGGELAHSVFRVGHIGHIELEDIDTLIGAFNSILTNGDAAAIIAGVLT